MADNVVYGARDAKETTGRLALKSLMGRSHGCWMHHLCLEDHQMSVVQSTWMNRLHPTSTWPDFDKAVELWVATASLAMPQQ